MAGQGFEKIMLIAPAIVNIPWAKSLEHFNLAEKKTFAEEIILDICLSSNKRSSVRPVRSLC
jgi:hypothetical protein